MTLQEWTDTITAIIGNENIPDEKVIDAIIEVFDQEVCKAYGQGFRDATAFWHS